MCQRAEAWTRQGKCNDCRTLRAGFAFRCFIQLLLDFRRRQLQLTCFDGGNACAHEAEFAYSQSVLGTNRRSEDATGHRAPGIEIAGAVERIEHGTGFVVGEMFKRGDRCIVFGQTSTRHITRKLSRETLHGILSATQDATGAIWIRAREFCQPKTKAFRIQLIDGEDTVTALGAAWTAFEPLPAPRCRILQRMLDNLDEFAILRLELRTGRHTSMLAVIPNHYANESLRQIDEP